MASYSFPFLDTLHMVKHHPGILKITTWLHPFHQVYTLARTHFGYLKYKNLIRIGALAREHVLLDHLLHPLSMVMPSMMPNLHMYMNEVTSFLMLGELIYLHFSRTSTKSSKVKVFASVPLGLSSNSPTTSLVASITIEEFVACGVLST
jgi:hypothetical protein